MDIGYTNKREDEHRLETRTYEWQFG